MLCSVCCDLRCFLVWIGDCWFAFLFDFVESMGLAVMLRVMVAAV